MCSKYKWLLTSTLIFASIQAQAFTSELKTIVLSDGETTTTRRCLPDNYYLSTNN